MACLRARGHSNKNANIPNDNDPRIQSIPDGKKSSPSLRLFLDRDVVHPDTRHNKESQSELQFHADLSFILRFISNWHICLCFMLSFHFQRIEFR